MHKTTFRPALAVHVTFGKLSCLEQTFSHEGWNGLVHDEGRKSLVVGHPIVFHFCKACVVHDTIKGVLWKILIQKLCHLGYLSTKVLVWKQTNSNYYSHYIVTWLCSHKIPRVPLEVLPLKTNWGVKGHMNLETTVFLQWG